MASMHARVESFLLASSSQLGMKSAIMYISGRNFACTVMEKGEKTAIVSIMFLDVIINKSS